MNDKNTATAGVPLSECGIWQELRHYYEREGVEAWRESVPFYATSNPSIANAYASIIDRFLTELIESGRATQATPFYIVELGAGSGTFGFYLLKNLMELQACSETQNFSFIYVMTDAAGKNIEFWRKHPALQIYINAGLLDFAHFDVLHDTQLTLAGTGKKLILQPDGDNAMVFIANYLFDSLSHDVFLQDGGKLSAGYMDAKAGRSRRENNRSVSFDELDPGFHYREVAFPHYPEREFDLLLKDYAAQFGDGYFSVPIGALRCLRRLRDISGDRFLLLASDKGYSRYATAFATTKPDIAFHGEAASMSVNFEVLGFYLRSCGGDDYHQPTQQGIPTSAFLAGGCFAGLPKTGRVLLERLCVAGPGDLLNLYRHAVTTQSNCSLETLVGYLNVFRWDPQLFNACIKSILTQVERVPNSLEARDLAENLPLVSANFFYLPKAIDTLSNIAMVLQQLEFYRSALGYYASSLEYFGMDSRTRYNMGVCHHSLQEFDQAQQCFAEAVALDPENIMARGWLAKISEERERMSREKQQADAVREEAGRYEIA